MNDGREISLLTGKKNIPTQLEYVNSFTSSNRIGVPIFDSETQRSRLFDVFYFTNAVSSEKKAKIKEKVRSLKNLSDNPSTID